MKRYSSPFIKRIRACASLVPLGLAGIAGAQENPPLSIDDAIRIGFAQNPQVVAGKAGVSSAYYNYRSLAALQPVVLSGSRVEGVGTDPDTLLDVGTTFDVSGQRRYEAAGANALFKSTQFGYREALLTLEQQIRDAYWSLAAAQAQTKIADVSLTEAKRVYDLTVSQEQAGAAPHGDVLRSSIDVANAKQTALAARGAERTALIAFNNLLGRKPDTPEPLNEDLANAANVPQVDLLSIQDLQVQALANRPLLKSATAQTKSADYAVRQAEASRFPDLGVDYQRSAQTAIDAFSLTASFPLLDFGSIRHSIRAARETRKQAQAQELQTKQQVEAQVAQAQVDLQLALESAVDYKKDILDPSVKLLEIAQLGYQQGATGILPIIDAESTIRNARVGYINSLLAIYKAQDETLAATGVLPKTVGK